MQTITDSSKFSTKPNGDGYTILWAGQLVGKIDFNITLLRWEYSRYSKYPEVAAGDTPEECLRAAEQDYAAVHQAPLVTVVKVHHTSTMPTYKTCGYGITWKQVGPGRSTKVTVRDEQGVFDIWIPASFARRLRPGVVCEYKHDRISGDFLRWPKQPVKRAALAA